MSKNPTVRNFVFTLNNPTVNGDLLFADGAPEVARAVWQLERGASGTPHFQGYMELRRPSRLGGVAKLVPQLAGAHFEQRKGSVLDAYDYCRKEDTRVAGPWELGEWSKPGQGKRSDLESVVGAIQGGATINDIARDHGSSFIKYFRGIGELHRRIGVVEPRDLANIRVVYWYGPSGCGKSHGCRVDIGRRGELGDPYSRQRGEFWNGYDGHRAVIFDDFSGADASYSEFKRWIDRYEIEVNIKGGSQKFMAQEIHITSTNLPDAWWRTDLKEFKIREITRRITEMRAWDVDKEDFIIYESDAEEDAYDKFIHQHPHNSRYY